MQIKSIWLCHDWNTLYEAATEVFIYNNGLYIDIWDRNFYLPLFAFFSEIKPEWRKKGKTWVHKPCTFVHVHDIQAIGLQATGKNVMVIHWLTKSSHIVTEVTNNV